MSTESIRIGTGFKVNSITQYPTFSQVNGEFMRDTNAPLQAAGAGTAFSFNVTTDEGKSLTAGKVYDFALVEQPTPTPAPTPDTTPTPMAAPVTSSDSRIA